MCMPKFEIMIDSWRKMEKMPRCPRIIMWSKMLFRSTIFCSTNDAHASSATCGVAGDMRQRRGAFGKYMSGMIFRPCRSDFRQTPGGLHDASGGNTAGCKGTKKTWRTALGPVTPCPLPGRPGGLFQGLHEGLDPRLELADVLHAVAGLESQGRDALFGQNRLHFHGLVGVGLAE